MATTTKTVCKCTKFTTSISDLPPEVLVHIFTFSPLLTRKSLKRVCRKWYECATRKAIVEKEKCVFKAGANLDEVCELMYLTNYPQLNFTFENYQIIQLPNPIWEACGDRVNTLELAFCEWNDETMANIIEHCGNLATLAVEIAETTPVNEKGDIGGFFAILSSLKITRPRLHTFTFYTNFTLVRESVLSQVMSVCPNIRHLNVAPTTLNARFIAYPQQESAALATCLNSVTQLESLKVNLHTSGHWLETLAERANAGIRLKCFETVLVFDDRLEERLLAFLTSQKDLGRIYLSIRYCDNNKVLKRMIYHILEACPKLRQLYFEYHPAIFHLESSEVIRFACLTSKLQYLALGSSIIGRSYYPQLVSLPNDPRLSILALVPHAFSIDMDVAAALLPQYNSLHHLEVSVNSDMVLQKIFQHLTNLKTLILGTVENCTDFGFTGVDKDRFDGFSINRLQGLKVLMIGSPDITTETLEHLELRSLKTISLDHTDALSKKKMIKFGRNLPNLKLLTVNMIAPSDYKWKVLCQSIKRLSYLCVEMG